MTIIITVIHERVRAHCMGELSTKFEYQQSADEIPNSMETSVSVNPPVVISCVFIKFTIL